VAWITFERSQFDFLSGQPQVYRSSPDVIRRFCATCGSALSYEHAHSAGSIDITSITLDEPNRFAPDREIWLEDRVPWEPLNPGLRHRARGSNDATVPPTRRLISSGSQFERDIGYSRAVVDGDWIFVSGTTGFDYASMSIADNVSDQAEQCLRNIQSALREAGADLADVVRVNYVLPDAARFSDCWPILRKYLGEVRPAATMISAGLADPRMQIEIEVTARRRAAPERNEA
jgi:enamine deaminase RidA (YjgF/YER057c/UK114 family)